MKNVDIDSILIQKISKGDESAFRELFMKYFARLCAFVQTILRSEDEPGEVVQKVFIRIWEKRKALTVIQSVYAYLVTACRNEAFSLIRMKTTRNKYETQYYEDYIQAESLEARHEGLDIHRIVELAINELPEKCRNIYTLSKKEGLSYSEIAEYLKISEKTVENQIGIALRKLREALQPHLTLIRQ